MLGILAFRIQRAKSPERMAHLAGDAAFLGPESGRIQKLLAEGGADAPGVQERISRILLIARIDNFFLILVVLDMALKPGL